MDGERSVYILLTNTGTLFTRVIKGYTGAPYNHASISFDRELSELYSFFLMTRKPVLSVRDWLKPGQKNIN
ncbi:MAG: hypothetical protein E6Z15_06375, partial [Paenibacillus macerans]|nr:hypothetical protein [Paenibacillus macerans]